MVFKTTFTKKRCAAFTLVELMVASALGLLILTAVVTFLLWNARSSAALDNYFALDLKTQLAVDKMSQQIRQVQKVTSFSTTNLTFLDFDGNTLQYNYDPAGQRLTRTKTNVTETLLTNCTLFAFTTFQETLASNSFQPYTTSASASTKVIQFTWKCSSSVFPGKTDTESMKAGMVVFRNK